jgi:hypothetical protein
LRQQTQLRGLGPERVTVLRQGERHVCAWRTAPRSADQSVAPPGGALKRPSGVKKNIWLPRADP